MNTTSLTPEELLAYNRVFIQALADLNDTAAAQRAQLLQQITAALAHGAPAETPFDGPAPDAAVQPAIPAVPAPVPAAAGEGVDAYAALVSCLHLAWQNALSIQQQTNITALAALTELLARLLGTPVKTGA